MDDIDYARLLKTLPDAKIDIYNWIKQNNEIVEQKDSAYVIVKNIKYDHLTLFLCPTSIFNEAIVYRKLSEYSDKGYLVFKNPRHLRTVKIDHWHLIEDIQPWVQTYKAKIDNFYAK